MSPRAKGQLVNVMQRLRAAASATKWPRPPFPSLVLTEVLELGPEVLSRLAVKGKYDFQAPIAQPLGSTNLAEHQLLHQLERGQAHLVAVVKPVELCLPVRECTGHLDH